MEPTKEGGPGGGKERLALAEVTPEELPRAVSRAVLKETIQHPLSVFPAAVSALGLLYLAAVSSSLEAFALAWFSALVSVGSWVFNYFVRGEKRAERYVARWREERERLKQRRLTDLRQRAAAQGFAEGAKECGELEDAYRKVRELLDRGDGGGSGRARFRVLADGSYEQGIAILESALRLHGALRAVPVQQLRKEREGWLAAIERGRRDGRASEEALRALAARVESHERLLNLYDERYSMLLQLLAEVEQLEAALTHAHLQLADLARAGAPEIDLAGGGAARELERAVTAARAVEERLRGMGKMGEASEEDQAYLEAGKKQR